MCEFYGSFLDVVVEWRSNEDGNDYDSWRGKMDTCYANVKILNYEQRHALLNFVIFLKKSTKKVQLVPKRRSMRSIHALYIMCNRMTVMCFAISSTLIGQFKRLLAHKKFEEMKILCFHIIRMFDMC